MNLQERADKWVDNCLKGVQTTRNHQSLPFKDNKIYSYGEHWILAEYDEKHKMFIVNTSHYSVSTSNHLSKVEWALRGQNVISLPFVRNKPYMGSADYSTWDLHLCNAKDNIKNKLKSLRAQQKRGRAGSGAYQWRERDIKGLVHNLVQCRQLKNKGWV